MEICRIFIDSKTLQSKNYINNKNKYVPIIDIIHLISLHYERQAHILLTSITSHNILTHFNFYFFQERLNIKKGAFRFDN